MLMYVFSLLSGVCEGVPRHLHGELATVCKDVAVQQYLYRVREVQYQRLTIVAQKSNFGCTCLVKSPQ